MDNEMEKVYEARNAGDADALASAAKFESYEMANVFAMMSLMNQQMHSQFEMLLKSVAQTHSELHELKDTLPLLPADQLEVQKMVNARIVSLLGGKKSNAYKDKSLRAKVFADINGELHRQFGVNNRAAISRKDVERVKHIVDVYSLPLVLEKEVIAANAKE